MTLLYWFLVILVTSGLAFWFGWAVNDGAAELERVQLLAQLDEATANVQLPRASYLPERPFAGAADPAQMAPIPWDLAGAAYALGQHRADQDAITRQVDAIMLEVELDPRWRYR